MTSDAFLGWKDGWLCAVDPAGFWPLFRVSHVDIWAPEYGLPLFKVGTYSYRMFLEPGGWVYFALQVGAGTTPLAAEAITPIYAAPVVVAD